MRKILASILIVLSFTVNAQEIKIKKNDLTIDGRLVAKVEEKDYNYTFKDLNGNTLFYASAKVKDRTVPNDKEWIIFKGANGNVREVPFKINTTMGYGKLFTKNAMAYGIFNKDGGDQAAIADFFATEDKSFSEDRNKTVNAIKDDRAAENALELNINSEGKIYDIYKKQLGSVTRSSIDRSQSPISGRTLTKFFEYRVYDTAGKLVAKMPTTDSDFENEHAGLKIYTQEGTQIAIQQDNGTKFNVPVAYDELANRMVKKLYRAGYLK